MAKIIRLSENDLNKIVKKVLKEHSLRDESGDLDFEFTDTMVMLKNMNQKKVQQYLSKLPNKLRILGIVNCEGADFSDVVLCSFTKLQYVNLKGTPNNLEENVDCEFEHVGHSLYYF